ncbi:hypothetical protein BGX30_006801 [Mortierella sp. GBA39]|nr:hypothetical protein BGX30_006801 [Mortierella sp. GBA39]
MANTWVDYAAGREDTEIVGLVDIKKEAALAMAERNHHGVSATALELGCDVFAEKPLAETMEDCLDIVRRSALTGCTHAVMQNRRYDPRIRAFRKLIAEGTIGRTGFIGADFFIGAHFGGFREAMASPLLLDMAIHTFDQARLITGANPVSVYCHEFNPPGSWYEGNAMAICIFEMSDGPEGDQDGKFIREYTRVPGVLDSMRHTFHHGCLDEMFAALEAGRKPETDCSDNIYSMAMVLAALESAKTGSKVLIREVMEAGPAVQA